MVKLLTLGENQTTTYMNLISLNLPKYDFKFKVDNDRTQIFDDIRKKYVVITPEEWVRQNFIQYLIQEKNYFKNLIAVEKKVVLNSLNKRFDILIHNKTGNPELIVECKAPKVKITQAVFNQAARYNFILRAKYLVVTNGLQHYACEVDFDKKEVTFLEEVPVFAS